MYTHKAGVVLSGRRKGNPIRRAASKAVQAGYHLVHTWCDTKHGSSLVDRQREIELSNASIDAVVTGTWRHWCGTHLVTYGPTLATLLLDRLFGGGAVESDPHGIDAPLLDESIPIVHEEET
jgi:hypothetical protein